MKKVFRIRPLDWQEIGMRSQPVTCYRANTILGRIEVNQNEQSKRWRFNWYFKEYYDEGTDDKTYATAWECQKAAQEFFTERLVPALEEVKQPLKRRK